MRLYLQELPGVVPLVNRVIDIEAFVALESNQGSLESLAENLGHLCFPNTGLPLQK